MKEKIEVLDYASEILKGVKTGVLLTTKSGDKVNTMTIAWGMLGIEWKKPIFIAYVRENRFTKKQLDENAEFTVNIPYGEYDKKIIAYCGTNSGKNVDKISELSLTLVDGELVNVPAIKELPLTLECKVIYSRLQDEALINDEIKEACYPKDVDSSFCGANKDYHVAYYGEIVNAYIVR